MNKDYYQILDIPEFSSSEEIKSAYRKLARKWHPDIAGNTSDVIAKFKDINEAYQILSDKNKRADYDTAYRFYTYSKGLRKEGSKNEGVNEGVNKGKDNTPKEKRKNNESFHFNSNGTYKSGGKDDKEKHMDKKGFSFNWEEFIAKKYREAQFRNERAKENHDTINSRNTPKKGEDVYSDVEISVFEAINGTTKIINMLQTGVCPKCGGRKFVNGTLCSYCNGKGESSTYKRFNIKIPAGIKNNSKIRLAGEGERGLYGGSNGDLYLVVHIQEPKNYKTDGLNILKTIAITPYEAVLGTNITVSTLKGNVNVKIAPNTAGGQKIRLSGCGIEQNNQIGDMIVTVEIQIPKNLTNEEINLYKKLSEIASSTVRDGLND